MASKTGTIKVKEGNSLVDFYPKTKVENVAGLSERLEEIQGADYSTIYQKAQDAYELASDLDEALKIPMTPVVRSDNNTFVYDGTTKAPTWEYLDTQRVVVSGTTEAINAGNYTTIFTPRYNSFTWSDTGTSAARSIAWSIARKQATSSISDTSFTIGVGSPTKTITVTTDGDGAVTATCSNPNLCTVSVSGKTVTCTALGSLDNPVNGTYTVTITLGDGTNYTGETWEVEGNTVWLTALKDATPTMVQAAAQNDLAASFWAIGDWFPMTLNGSWQCTDNTITLNNYVIRCVLIGINHNADKEGNHMLHFQMGKNTNNVDVAFYYSKMNTENTNSGGWKSCKMRTITMANLYNTIIPSNWRAVIKPCTKYTDNTGGGSDNASYVTATSDNCFLLAEYEVFGSRTYANSAEQNYQKQYAYYANGNSKVRYRHDSPTTNYHWWCRSVWCSVGDHFVLVSRSGDRGITYAYQSDLISPAFCIG